MQGMTRRRLSSLTHDLRQVQHQQAETLIRVASADALEDLAEIGLLPETVAHRTAETVTTGIENN